jgi:hypothetical protein
MAQDGTTAGGASYTLDNVTFPVGRNKLQSIFDAIRSTNIGNNAPDLVAGQFWIDNNTPSTTVWTLYFYDGTDSIQFATIDTINNTVNFIDSAFDLIVDTTPQLGGNLDLNSNNITGTGNIDITGTVTSDGLTVDGNASLTTSGANGLVINERTDVSGNSANIFLSDSSGTVGIQSNNGEFRFNTGATVGSSSGTERLRIKSSVLVINENSNDYDFRVESDNNTHALFVDGGTDTVLMAKGSVDNTTAGHRFNSDGFVSHVRSGNGVMRLNRLSNDGDILEIYKDGATVGSIGASGGDIFMTEGNFGLRLYDNGTSKGIIPSTGTGAGSNNIVDLGGSGLGYKNLYLSGTVTNDGTGGMSIDTSGNVTFNEDGGSSDFRVETNTRTHMIFADGGTDRLSIWNNASRAEIAINSTNILIGGTGSVSDIFMHSGLGGGYTYAMTISPDFYGQTIFYEGSMNASADATTSSQNEWLRVKNLETVFNDNSLDKDFRVESNTNTHALFVQGSDGNVGIGENSVESKFHVKDNLASTGVGTSSNPIVIIQNERLNTGTSSAVLRFDTNEIAGSQQHPRASIGAELEGNANSVDGRLLFATTDNSGNMTERMRIDSFGNVGIGTSSPSELLEVNGNIRVGVGSQTAPSLQIGDNDTGIFDAGANAIGFTTAGTEKVRILSGGSVAIGATSASQKLHVEGSIYTSGSLYVGGTGSANALDDYEEGTWTPSLEGTTTNPTLSYNHQVGRYTKIGRTVTIDFYIQLNTTGNSGGTGDLLINGFPFGVGSLGTHGKSGLCMYTQGFSTVGNGAPIGFFAFQNTTYAYFRSPVSSYPSSSFHTSTLASDILNSLIVAGTLTYQIT